MFMEDLFTSCFSPKGPSPGYTYIKITKNGYFFFYKMNLYLLWFTCSYIFIEFFLSAFSAPLFRVWVGIEVYSVYVQLVSTHLRVID